MTISEYLQIRDKKIYYTLHQYNSDNPTIIFLHDSLGCVTLWRDFPEKLAYYTNCNILVYDRIGYGKSDNMESFVRTTNYLEIEADILNEIIQKLELKNNILFGHSDGGSIALLMASKYPDTIKAIISEAAHIFVEPETLSGIIEAKKSYETTNLKQRLEKYHGDKVENLFLAWTKTWMNPEYKTWNIEEFLPNIKAPLLFIQGENDEFGTLKQVHTTVNSVSGKTEAFIIPKLGHTPHKENAELILKKSSEFILSII